MEEIEQLKRDTKNAFLELAKSVDDCFSPFKKDIFDRMLKQEELIEGMSQKISAKDNEKTGTEFLEIDNEKRHKEFKSVKPKRKKPSLAWVGTTVSKVLDEQKLSKDCNIDTKFVQTSGILSQKQDSMKKSVNKLIEEDGIDILVLQGGEQEISNIKVNDALTDTSRDLSDYKKEWFTNVEKDSAEVFGIAENAVKVNPNMQTVIVKRMNRFDKGSADILGIKSSLSTYANNYYEQLWLKAGRPQNIKLVDIDMKVDSPGHLKQLIFGSCGSENYDGVHLRGPGASRHFNYRAKQAIRSTIDEVRQSLSQKESHPTGIHRETYSNAVISANNPRKTDSRTIFLDQKSQ